LSDAGQGSLISIFYYSREKSFTLTIATLSAKSTYFSMILDWFEVFFTLVDIIQESRLTEAVVSCW
jgi:hypothetical protein